MGFSSFGFLNFCYRLWRSKKFRKFVIGFGFLAFVFYTIISNTNIVFGAQSDAEYTTDTTINILESYQRNVDIFVKSFNTFYGKNDTATQRFNQLFNSITATGINLNLYLRHYSVDNDNLNILLYSKNNYNISNQVTTNWSPDGPNASYNMVPTTGYNITFSYNMNIGYQTLNPGTIGSVSVTDFIPSVLLYRMPSEIVECMEKAGYTYNGPIVDIQQNIEDLKQTMEDIKGDIEKTERTEEEQEEQEQAMEDMSSEIVGATETNESESLVTNMNSYFDSLTNTLTYNEFIVDSITIPIPFTTQSVILRSDLLDMVVSNWNFNPLGSTMRGFIQTIWFFVFGKLIFDLIWRIVEYFGSGEFLNDEGYKSFRSILHANYSGISPLML